MRRNLNHGLFAFAGSRDFFVEICYKNRNGRVGQSRTVLTIFLYDEKDGRYLTKNDGCDIFLAFF